MHYTEFAPAKINLSLHICGKRPDGYHLLHSLVAFARDIGDTITIKPSQTLELEITGPYAGYLDKTAYDTTRTSGNLVIRAAYALADMSGIPLTAHITLEKNLPVSSGIGGGSSDAAALIKALSAFWNIAPDKNALRPILSALGADLPVCYEQQTSIMEGIGEIITPYHGLPALPVILINPLIPCPTKNVFGRFNGQFTPLPAVLPPAFANVQEFTGFIQAECRNDLQPPAIEAVPEIKNILAALEKTENCMLARLSGSGATCFGIYPTPQSAASTARILQENHKNWWIKAGTLG